MMMVQVIVSHYDREVHYGILLFQSSLDYILQRVSVHGEMSVARSHSLISSILLSHGPCTPLRSVQRHFMRVRADTVVEAMSLLTRPQEDPMFVGQLGIATPRKMVRVFYKCPPLLVKKSALEFYGISFESYTQRFESVDDSGDQAKNAKRADYYCKLMNECPFFLA